MGIPSQDMFILSDLHSARSIPAVLQNIYALGRQAQVIPGFKGPKLGVTFNVSIEEQKRRLVAKKQEQERKVERERQEDERKLKRRTEIETQKKVEIVDDLEEAEVRVLDRKLSKGRISPKDYKLLKQASHEKFNTIRKQENTDIVQGSDIRYGMDQEIAQKRRITYDHSQESQVMNWIEMVTGEPLDDFYGSLKSGVILCKLLSTIYPGCIPEKQIDTRANEMVYRVCLKVTLKF